ncbi:Adaptin-N domain-containing protein [Mycena sanguinolenta]|uniref:Adaptin-N domain-containing protein n=1 Tax=Mycena sanguinolenta TaxID=230812 RepID=A0A8H6ZEB8_9AGAR|nr:Adaptin-N domain-containing protein [Mycena sanguinolenta]
MRRCGRHAVRLIVLVDAGHDAVASKSGLYCSLNMDVPFVQSGALNRAHYALVRNVESAPSPEMADSYILKEVESIRYRLRHPTLSLVRVLLGLRHTLLKRATLSQNETKECLTVLLYCSMSITSAASLPTGSLDFALPQAVNLSEAGKKVHDKQIGYLFCAEIMSPTHELRLMLVNTLRKDLESPTTALICLALDNLITSPSEDVIPAVQSRLQDLLSNPSPHVRRRALLACSALSRHEPELLRRVTSKVLKRLRDHHPEVVDAALTVSLELFKLHEAARNDVKGEINTLLQSSWSSHHEQSVRCIILQILRTLRHVGLLHSHLGLVLQIIQTTSKSSDHPVMYAAFLLLLDVEAREIMDTQTSQSLSSPAASIRDLLTSRSVNDQYIFLSCLGCLNPELWAGTNAEIPAVLDEWEVGKVMEFLDSSDPVMRQKTLRILNSADPNIVNSYYSQSLKTLPADLNIKGLGEYTTRLLEVLELQTEGDGELYARELAELFTQMEARSPRYAQLVVESAVEMVLLFLRNAPMPFQIGCVTTLVASLTNPEFFLGQTMIIIVSALAAEYAGKLAVPPPDVLRGLAARLPLCSLAVQDACLLTMLRVSAECEQVPSDVVIAIRDLSSKSKRHIRQRCEEFTTLSAQKGVLLDVIRQANSSSLPDFLEALHRYRAQTSANTKKTSDTANASSPSSSRVSLSENKLRYTAYDAPPPAPRLRDRALSRGSSHSNSSASSRVSADLSRTVTAGDLTLAAAAQEFEMATLSPHSVTSTTSAKALSPQAADLIAFNDSPFISDPGVDSATANASTDFESIWNGFDESSGARGWCDVSLEDVIKRLESLEDTFQVIPTAEVPFRGKFSLERRCPTFILIIHLAGDLKILMNGNDLSRGLGVLRLRASEEGGCLWRLRCGDAPLRIRVKRLLTSLE